MWESLDKIVGGYFRPKQIKREGKASIDVRVEETLRLAQAEQYADAIRRGDALLERDLTVKLIEDHSSPPLPINITKSEMAALIDSSIRNQIADQIRKDVNVAKAILHAESELQDDNTPTPEALIDQDWLYRWRDNASEVSTEELQSLWGKVLAGETKAPGSFSLRTLNFLRNISKDDAEAITKLAPFYIGEAIYRGNKEVLDAAGITTNHLLKMQELGILVGVEAVSLTNTYESIVSEKFMCLLKGANKALIIESPDGSKTFTLQVCRITEIGIECGKLCNQQSHHEYLQYVGKKIQEQGFVIKWADYRENSDNTTTAYNIEEFNFSVATIA